MRRPAILYVGVLAAVWAAWLALYVFVLAVDPYELRWASGERLAERRYPQQLVPGLAPAAARSGADVAIVGASTAVGYTPAMMRQAFPDARAPINLAYIKATGSDLARILARLEGSRRLRRVIINLDYTLADLRPSGGAAFAGGFFTPSWHDPVPEFNLDSVALAFSVARTGVLDSPWWRSGDDAPWLDRRVVRARAKHRAAAVDVRQARATVTAGGPVPCEAMPGLTEAVMPAVRRLAARGVAVDLVAPPYSLAFYYQAAPRPGQVESPESFTSMMALRRCTMQLSAGIPNVRFFSFDSDLALVGDASNYADIGHLQAGAPFQKLLRRIAAGDGVVAPGDWPNVEARLKAELAAYRGMANQEPRSPP